MASPRGHRIRQTGFQSQRRKSSWGVGVGDTTASPFTASGVGFLGSTVFPTVPGLTIVRIRGQCDVMLTLATTAGDGFQGAVGIGIATTTAVTAGIPSLPTPIREAEDENWLWWHPFSVHNPVVSSSGLTEASHQRIIIDSKAMRKFDEGMSIYAAAEVVEIGTATMTMFFDTRMLLKLP